MCASELKKEKDEVIGDWSSRFLQIQHGDMEHA